MSESSSSPDLPNSSDPPSLIKISEREEVIGFRESEEIEWRQYLADFRARIWPMYKEYGFTFPEAFHTWRQEMMITKLEYLLEAMDPPQEF